VTVRLGSLQSRADRFDDAMKTLEPVVKAQKDPEAQAELGYVKFRKEQYPEALRLLTAAAKAKPDLMIAQYYLGAALYQRGDLDGARKAYELADALAGSDSRPLEAWCELEKQQESPKLAEVKKRLEKRFGKEGVALAKKCAP
jgi:Flp pilus assembly protein TadD